MLNALLLVFAPLTAWGRITQSSRSLGNVLLGHLLPLAVLSSAVEGYGLVRWGEWRGAVAHLRKFSTGEAIIFETIQCLLLLLVVFIGAKLTQAIGETFHGRHRFHQAFTAIAFGMTPFFVLHFFDAFPSISPWLTWSVGILLSVGVLYQGLPRVMQPDPPHAFGLYLMSSLLLILISGLARFVTALYLAGKLSRLENVISSAAKWFS